MAFSERNSLWLCQINIKYKETLWQAIETIICPQGNKRLPAGSASSVSAAGLLSKFRFFIGMESLIGIKSTLLITVKDEKAAEHCPN
jgi:hypothetical protein